MKNNMWIKGLVVGIIGLFMGTSILPGISADIEIGITSVENQSNETTSESTVDWWPMFRHDANNSGSTTSYGPVTNSVLWRFTPGGIWVRSAPAIVNGKIYFGSVEGKVFCLSAGTGKKIWEFTTNDLIDSSPAVVDGRVYVGSVDNNLYCLNADTGVKIWSSKIGRLLASPTVVNNRVYINSYNGYMFCLNTSDGSKIWIQPTEYSSSSAAVVNGRVLFGAGSRFYCLNADTGFKYWDFETGFNVDTSPCVANGKVYFGSSDQKVYCFNIDTGTKIWDYETGSPVRSSPAVLNGKVYIGSDDNIIYCLNADTGKRIWQYTTGGGVSSSPAIADGKLYIGSGDGKVYCLNAENGMKIWDYTTASSVVCSPTIADGRIYIGSDDRRMYCFSNQADDNNPPEKPTIKGKTHGSVNTQYNYIVETTDPEQNRIKYYIDWGDSTTNTGYNESGEEITISHTWTTKGSYNITIEAIDEYGEESDWATLPVTMPCDKIIDTTWLQSLLRILKNYIRLYSIIQKIIDPIKSISYEKCDCNRQIQKYGLGYIPFTNITLTPVVETEKLPPELDWRSYTYNNVTGNWLTPVKNQGSCGSCYAFAAIGCLEAMINIFYKNPSLDMDLSEQYLVSCGAGNGCNGGSAYGCFWFMKYYANPNDGALPESCFPYTSGSGSVPSCNSKCSDWTKKLVKSIGDYGSSSGSTQIKTRLLKGPVCLSFYVYDDFYKYTGGVYEYKYGAPAGAHQVVCVGYSDSGGYWICKNSWGTSWGESGWFKIKYGECNIESSMTYVDFCVNFPPASPNNPNPQNHMTGVFINTDLSWVCNDFNNDALVYDIYFGENANPSKVVSGLLNPYYDPGKLALQTKYYWKVVARDPFGAENSSPIWDFTTNNDNLPNSPNNPNPADQATNVNINTNLSWIGGDPDVDDTVTYNIYFGTENNPPLLIQNVSSISCDPGILDASTKYYWKVVATDNHGGSENGSIWSFTTINDPPNKPAKPSGEKRGELFVEYIYSSNTSDMNDDMIYYLWDWGDGSYSEWLGPYNSEITVNTKHFWKTKGSYAVKVKSKDEHDAESTWSDPLPITMPYNIKPIWQNFFDWLFQRYPNAFPVLRHLMGD